MPAIGYVTKQASGGFKGHIKTLSIRAEIELVPNSGKSADTQPDYRVVTQGVEIGAGWVRKAESSGPGIRRSQGGRRTPERLAAVYTVQGGAVGHAANDARTRTAAPRGLSRGVET